MLIRHVGACAGAIHRQLVDTSVIAMQPMVLVATDHLPNARQVAPVAVLGAVRRLANRVDSSTSTVECVFW